MALNLKLIQGSIQIGIKRPILGIILLANSFAKCIEHTSIAKDLKVRLCLLLQNIIDKADENHNNTALSNSLQNRSIYLAIRLLKRYPK